MDITSFFASQWDVLGGVFKHPNWLIGIPIAFIILLWLVFRDFVTYGFDDRGRRKLRRIRRWVFLLRWLAVSLILVALATPSTTITKETAGNPHALILVDRSGSMGLYDTSTVPFLAKEIGDRIPTTVREFGSETSSPIGDAALGNPEHLLIISDGNANTGVSLLDVAQVARSQNLSINMIDLQHTKRDMGVVIDAPLSVPLGFPAEIIVGVSATDGSPVPLKVAIDGRIVYDDIVTGSITLQEKLGTGYHKIEATIPSGDEIASNNAHYRVIQVLEKPKVFVVTSNAGELEAAIGQMFDIKTGTSLPSDLPTYSAVVINDVAASKIGGVSRLADFLRDDTGKYGNGLVVLGGFNSYDRGGYAKTDLESLLPVRVGKAKKDFGENNLVFVVQVSGSTGGTKYVADGQGNLQQVTEDEPTIDVIKAQAVSAINSLNLRNNVGVIAFGVSTAGESYASPQEALQASVVKIADVKPLYNHKQELTDKIPRLTGGGTTAPDIALKTAVDMLKDKSGDKTIIFLTNGRFSAGLGVGNDVPAKANTLAVVENAYKRYGIRTQTIGVGSADNAVFEKKVDESFLKDVAVSGDSTYDRGTNLRSLMVKYGDPQEKGFGDSFNLVPLSLTHFITRDVELDAVLNGFNEVAPKEGSRLLVTTDAGDAAVTVWNYFNGRVASMTVFTGNGLGPLLRGESSDLLRNTILWAVGDPARKQAVSVEIPPATVDVEAKAVFTSKDPISGNCQDTPLQFESNTGDVYTFSFTPTKAGFGTACGVPYAVNGPSEYWRVGENQDLQTAVGVTEGGIFTFDQVDEIVEQIKTVSTRVAVQKTELRNPFIALALFLFLIEIFIRRLTKIH